ncbi:MAG: SurA N-terminal domain-containing protein [Bacteroidales bacterium]|nr:SurA N-terminal domain-containing protein [Bacteroidales bacterium]
MATLQKIRNKAGLLALIIGFALFAFIIGDFLNSGSSLFRQSQEKIAKIGDTSLDYKEYEARITEMEEVYKIQTGQNTLDDAIVGQIRESVYESIVRERLLDDQAEKLGVSVTGKEVFNMINGANVHPMIQQLPIFQNPQTGAFDRMMMMNFLQTIQKEDLSQYTAEVQEQIKSLKKYWLFWENNLKYTRLEEKLNTLLGQAVQANSLDAEASFANRSINVDIAYVFQPYTSQPDSLFKVSKNSLKKRYNAEKERFAQKPYRTAKYIVVDVAPSNEDYKAIETGIQKIQTEFAQTADIENFVNDNSDDFYMDCFIANRSLTPTLKSFVEKSDANAFLNPVYVDGTFVMARLLGKTVAPDSVKARQIVIAPNNQALADSLLAVIKNGGNFAEIAAKYSQNGGNAEMGWFREADAISLGSNFVRSCFNAPLNAAFLVKTKRSLNIVEVTNKTAAVAKSKLGVISMKVTPSSVTYSSVYNKVNHLVAENQNATAFFAAAEKAGYEVQEAQTMRQTDNTLANIPQMRQAVRFVFNNEEEDLSSILENQNNQFVVIGITGINDGDYQKLDNVKQYLERELINELKGEKIAADLKAKKAATIESLALSTNMKIDSVRFVDFAIRRMTGVGDEPAMIAAVTNAPVNQMSAPVIGKNGVYVFKVISKTKSQEQFDIQLEKANFNSNNMYRLRYQAFGAVRNALKVEDSRIRFY